MEIRLTRLYSCQSLYMYRIGVRVDGQLLYIIAERGTPANAHVSWRTSVESIVPLYTKEADPVAPACDPTFEVLDSLIELRSMYIDQDGFAGLQLDEFISKAFGVPIEE